MPLMIGKNSGGVLNVTSADGTGSTNLVLPESGTVIAADASGNITLGTGTKIQGDFSNATFSNRTMFQTSTVNGMSYLSVIPNGTSTNAGISCFASSDANNSAFGDISNNGAYTRIRSTKSGTGSFTPIAFFTSDTETMRIDTSGNVGVGTTPMRKFHIHDTSLPIIQLTNSTTGNTDANRGGLIYQSGAGMYFTNKENGYSIFGNNGLAQVQISPTGDLLLTSGTGGIGYGTGSGGTVTQATSKSTAVTLNKPTGQITMNNAALAAGASVVFIVNNSLITGNDMVELAGIYYLVNPSNYRMEIAYMAYNNFAIRVTNISGVSLSEALMINFSIIKGATV